MQTWEKNQSNKYSMHPKAFLSTALLASQWLTFAAYFSYRFAKTARKTLSLGPGYFWTDTLFLCLLPGKSNSQYQSLDSGQKGERSPDSLTPRQFPLPYSMVTLW